MPWMDSCNGGSVPTALSKRNKMMDLSRSLGKCFEAYLVIDNVLDKTYTTDLTSEGVISIGEPRIIHGGVQRAL